MAFNFRAKSEAEIKQRKKPYSLQAAKVYSFIRKQYGEIIILDPNKDFSDIKIPRVVEKRENIKRVKERLSKAKIDISDLKIQFGNGSGTGGSSINAAETAKQENATRFVCEQVIEKGKFPRDSEIEKIYAKYDDEWYETFKMQSDALKKWLKGKKGYEYSRDKGAMPIIEKAAQNCGVKQKDSWNPADIYIIKKQNASKILKKIEQIGDRKTENEAKLDALNEYMRDLFVKRELVGISLKKLGKSVSLEETNVGGLKLSKISMIKNSLRCDLDIDNKGEFNTGEMAFAIDVDGKVINVQVRAFSGGVRESTQMDMTGSGAAAKLGKVSSRAAIDPFIKKFKLERRMATDLPKVGEFTNKDIDFYEKEQSKLSKITINGSKIYFGKVPWKKSFKKARQLEIDNNRTASQLSSKLQCFRWLEILKTLEDKKELINFLNIAYYGAKKQYASAGPFLKIS
tara:strand:+ start:702 stop:2072 length:1371 start_codon:yes stop_codon:yes gene_type:complete